MTLNFLNVLSLLHTVPIIQFHNLSQLIRQSKSISLSMFFIWHVESGKSICVLDFLELVHEIIALIKKNILNISKDHIQRILIAFTIRNLNLTFQPGNH